MYISQILQNTTYFKYFKSYLYLKKMYLYLDTIYYLSYQKTELELRETCGGEASLLFLKILRKPSKIIF